MRAWQWALDVVLLGLVAFFMWWLGDGYLAGMQRRAREGEVAREARNSAYRRQACLHAPGFFQQTSECFGRATLRLEAHELALFDLRGDASAWCSTEAAPSLRVQVSAAVRLSAVQVTYFVNSKRPTAHPKQTEVAWEGGSVVVASPALKPGASTVPAALPAPISSWIEVRPRDFPTGVGKPPVCISELALYGTMPVGPEGVLGLASAAAH